MKSAAFVARAKKRIGGAEGSNHFQVRHSGSADAPRQLNWRDL
jgi:hypothetical protein